MLVLLLMGTYGGELFCGDCIGVLVLPWTPQYRIGVLLPPRGRSNEVARTGRRPSDSNAFK